MNLYILRLTPGFAHRWFSLSHFLAVADAAPKKSACKLATIGLLMLQALTDLPRIGNIDMAVAKDAIAAHFPRIAGSAIF